MDAFSISNIYEDENSRRVVDINPLSGNYCSFDCVFCPLGRTKVKTEDSFFFEETEGFIERLDNTLKGNDIDVVFINPNGESLANRDLIKVIEVIKNHGVKVRLLSNGYILNKEEYKETLSMCDEVIGELAVVEEEDFQRIQRPIEGYTLDKYVNNMASFKKWYKEKFIIDITILKGYSDSDEAVEKLKKYILRINPDEVSAGMTSNEKVWNTLGVSQERLRIINNELKAVL